MADRQIVVWNANTGTLQCVQVGDGATMTGDLTIVGNIAVSGTVDGQDLAALGTKLGLITITGSQNIDNIATDAATAKAATDFLTVTGAINLDTVKTKTDNITVTGPVNLDDLASIAASLDQSLTYQGNWDASLGVFPTSTLTGELWRCNIAGTIDTNDYEVGDFIFALIDGASTILSSSWGWLRTNQTHVRTVNSKSGDVTLVEADISDLQTYLTAVDIDSLAKLNALISDSVVIEDAINTFAGLQVLVADETVLAASSIDTIAKLNTIISNSVVAADGTVPMTYVDLTPGTPPIHAEGRVFYDNSAKTLSYFTDDADVTMNVGEENWIRIRNDTGGTILNGEAVYISGASGGIPQVSKLVANGDRCIGVATHDIETGTVGRVTTHGVLNDVDMSSFSIGDKLWLSPLVAGALQNTQPAWPDISIEIGVVLDNAVLGKLLVDIEHHGNGNVLNKSYNFSSRTASSGTYYLGGFYEISTTDANLTQASPTVVMGTANSPYAAHAFMVFGAGSTDGANITITVSGTSITDAGVRTSTDSEVLYTGPVAGLTLNDMKESVKKWIGQVTYTLTSDGTTFTCDFNYGLAKYEDFHNFDFTLRAFEFVGLADAADAGFDMEIIHHSNSGWTYAATGFIAKSPLHQFTTEHGTESDVKAGEHFAWKESNVTTSINGSALEGLIIRVTTTVNNSISYLNGHLTVTTE